MKEAIVVINEQHTLLEEQEAILNAHFGGWEFLKVPATGWTLNEIHQAESEIAKSRKVAVILSPIPIMILDLVRANVEVRIFHNDNREKKELPNGKVISVVAKTGWQLL